MVKKKIPCLILARGGSKSIPKKNIKKLIDKPLLGWVIDAAKKAEYIGDIYVSTDDLEISNVAISFGAKVIKRPESISTDTSLDIEAFEHAIGFIENCEEIVQLRATTPTISPNVLDSAIKYYIDNKKICSSLRSAHEMPESIFKYFTLNGIFFTGLLDNYTHSISRQFVKKTYIPNGYVDIIKLETIKNNKSIHGDKILAYITESVIEIDSIEEFEFLEYKLKNLT